MIKIVTVMVKIKEKHNTQIFNDEADKNISPQVESLSNQDVVKIRSYNILKLTLKIIKMIFLIILCCLIFQFTISVINNKKCMKTCQMEHLSANCHEYCS